MDTLTTTQNARKMSVLETSHAGVAGDQIPSLLPGRRVAIVLAVASFGPSHLAAAALLGILVTL